MKIRKITKIKPFNLKFSHIIYERHNKRYAKIFYNKTINVYVDGDLEKASKIAEKHGIPIYIILGKKGKYTMEFKDNKFPKIEE